MKGQAVAAAGRFLYFSGSDTLPDAALVHLDVGACVGVWHSDAVMQPGPRDGRGSTNGAPMDGLADDHLSCCAKQRAKENAYITMGCQSWHVGRLRTGYGHEAK